MYRSIILGSGRIAGGYDKPGDAVALTHAHAITRTPNIELAGFYDVQPSAAAQMASKWQTDAYRSIEEAFEKATPEIVTIAVPDEFHEQVLETLQGFSPKAIVCEKPLGTDLGRLKGILENYKKKKIAVAVNFNRNHDARMIELKKQIGSGAYGDFLNAVFFYSKGIRHNGSHAISLLRYLFGEIEDFKVLDRRIDYKKDDPTVDVQLRFKGGTRCYMLAGDERKYSIFEADFLFSQARITLRNDGFYFCSRPVIDDPLFPGYRTLGNESVEETGLPDSLTALYQNVTAHLENGTPLMCPADDAWKTQSVIEKILNTI